MKKFNTLEFEKIGLIGVLTLSREAQLNALNAELLTELEEFLQLATQDQELQCLILTGKGKAFVAGADIKEMQNSHPQTALEMACRGQRIFARLEEAPFVNIAAINGFALGGGLELALACDIILASTTAKLGLPEVSLGLIPGYGGTQRLARSIGQHRAKYVVLSGQIFTAEEAFHLGLVAKLLPPDQLKEEAMKLAQTVAMRSPHALTTAKHALQEGFDHSLSEGLAMEASAFASCFQSGEAAEGISAFIAKRPPAFRSQ
jgi:enoyl-CoA hydratase